MDRGARKGMAVVVVVLIAIAAMLLMPGHKKVHPPNDDPWVLVSYDPDNPVGTYLGNGFISTRIMGDGVGSQTKTMPDGSVKTEPLPCYMAGLYDDEKLVPIPTWSDLRFYDGKTQFRVDKNADYRQSLDMRTGILTTEATWRAGRKRLTGKIEVIVSRARPDIGIVRASLVPHYRGSVICTLRLADLRGAKSFIASMSDNRVGSNICMAASIVWIEGTSSTGVTSTALQVRPDERFAATAVVSIMRPPVHVDVTDLIPLCKDPGPTIAAHKAAWAKLWRKDIKIDGSKRDQQAVRSCMFYLLQSVREGSQWSIPPMGLSNNTFSGHVFWDADTWMFPALILQHPELARSIVDYRYNTLKGAMENAKASGHAGAEYAWESGYTGKEDTPPHLVYRHERHINGDVALAQWQYYLATNDLAWLKSRGFPVLKATADYWVSRVTFVPDKGRYEIKQVVPPDENAELVDNSVYTNAIAKMNLQIAARAAKLCGAAANPKWTEVADKLYIPFDDQKKRFIAHDGYKGIEAKQADAELLAYPLQFEMPGYVMPFVYTNTYQYYAPKVFKVGPAMTSSAHSVIAARLGLGDEAYKQFVKSYKPFLRGPFNYFNEKQSKYWDAMCFLTGAAGPIQASIFGLAGAQMDYFPEDPSEAELTFRPNLPKQWKSLTITGVQWHGKTFDVTVSEGNKVKISK